MTIEISDIFNFVYLIFNTLSNGIRILLEMTILKASPILADKYADSVSLLITITALWILLEFSTGFKKIVKYVVIAGWILLCLSFIIEVFA